MIDFHCHVDLYPNPKDIVAKAEAEGIYVLAVTTTPKAWEGNQAVLGAAKRIRLAVGLHPELVADRHAEVERLCELLPSTRYVGEVGLDGGARHRRSLALQVKVLDRVLAACSENGGRILSLHSRGAVTPLLDALASHPKAGVPVLHRFSGTYRELERAVEGGCWFSLGPGLLARKSRTPRLAVAMPRDRVLTETDGPFARRGSAPLMPWDVQHVERELAQMWACSPEEACATLLSNLRRLVARPGQVAQSW